jgi:hypothetical protein
VEMLMLELELARQAMPALEALQVSVDRPALVEMLMSELELARQAMLVLEALQASADRLALAVMLAPLRVLLAREMRMPLPLDTPARDSFSTPMAAAPALSMSPSLAAAATPPPTAVRDLPSLFLRTIQPSVVPRRLTLRPLDYGHTLRRLPTRRSTQRT